MSHGRRPVGKGHSPLGFKLDWVLAFATAALGAAFFTAAALATGAAAFSTGSTAGAATAFFLAASLAPALGVAFFSGLIALDAAFFGSGLVTAALDAAAFFATGAMDQAPWVKNPVSPKGAEEPVFHACWRNAAPSATSGELYHLTTRALGFHG